MFRLGRGNTNTCWELLFEDIHGSYKYVRDKVIELREEIQDRAVWRNAIKTVSLSQKNKHQPNTNTNTSASAHTITTAEMSQEKELYRVVLFHQFELLISM